MKWFRRFVGSLLILGLSACQGVPPEGPRGAAAYSMIPGRSPDSAPGDYKIGPLDVLSITVFQEPDLSFKEIPVDANGGLNFPLIGTVTASGKTANELSREIANLLNQRYLKDPQVSVVVSSSVSQHVTVEGSVTEPGVYEISGRSTLLEAIARAKSPTRTAKLDEVVIFRVINGKRSAAVFDLRAIRAGKMDDPELIGGDVVVVGFSAAKGLYRDFLQTAPILALFRYF
ncbi:polysaccharide biosynthesis/export family protein [Sphingomonas oligophenolica]|uniref:Polysaccharide biosynthesis/export family protein n=1 Tax=Sphingomonas oligophenolica TaxID=301154 RepID=A0ABU9YCT4_9SPHN